MQQDEKRAEQPRFATQADRDAWLNDIGAFGMAIVDANGKHVDLKEELARLKPKRD